jgi:hypothetical protein
MNAPALSITPQEREQIERAATPLINAARECRVTNPSEYNTAATQLKRIKAAQKLLAEKKATLVSPIRAALKAALALFAAPEIELDQAEGLYKRAMLNYDDEQDRLRKAEQAKLDRAAEEERRRKEEQARKAEADAKAARDAGNLAKAEKLEAKADTLASTAASIVAPQAQREAPKVSGISTRENWSALVLSLPDLVQAVAAGKVPIIALEANMKVLNQLAKSLKKELNWPGVRAVVDKGIAAGSV